ncbi:hypothetical protein [Candidatus Venteria ishoeyi]|uniref:Uncharacterized protein n=1 Tax=Candidatus Venteria ishoeyi TaxID=1899563 RepID=A0A1H6F6K1_9GAMM|nr:hypothetical protein [Candidatus Venteria ishoeyi]SEH05760.1 Uncharacterised protein [Candidatus Venteria ishoeyi]
MKSLLKTFVAITLLAFPFLVSADNQYKVMESNTLLYQIGALLGLNTQLTLRDREYIQVASMADKSCIKTLQGPHSDQNIAVHGTTFLKSIQCFATQRGQDERHFCFDKPLKELLLYRHQADNTEEVTVLDTNWRERWAIKKNELSWPLAKLPVDTAQSYRSYTFKKAGERIKLHFHYLSETLSASEKAMVLHECKYQKDGIFYID